MIKVGQKVIFLRQFKKKQLLIHRYQQAHFSSEFKRFFGYDNQLETLKFKHDTDTEFDNNKMHYLAIAITSSGKLFLLHIYLTDLFVLISDRDHLPAAPQSKISSKISTNMLQGMDAYEARDQPLRALFAQSAVAACPDRPTKLKLYRLKRLRYRQVEAFGRNSHQS